MGFGKLLFFIRQSSMINGSVVEAIPSPIGSQNLQATGKNIVDPTDGVSLGRRTTGVTYGLREVSVKIPPSYLVRVSFGRQYPVSHHTTAVWTK